MAERGLPGPTALPRTRRVWTGSLPPAARDRSWPYQAVSGVLVFALIALHMVAHHFVVPEGLRNFAEVIAYLTTPVILALEVAFLLVVTWHGLLGLRAVIYDFGLSRRTERRVTLVLSVVGVATIAYGLWLTWTIVNQA